MAKSTPPIPRDHPDDGDGRRLIDPFVAEVMTSMLTETERTTNLVMDNYKAEIAELKATIALIREDVELMFNGKYMPVPNRVLAALYPSTQRVKELAASDDQA